ncbi:hypothetical protein [Clostridium saccharoperbutylacetonicum]|uniref:hypothetical protein n=1 Tax=Clostridium saccharoperbutylacetonicum TaxID=36745 RepID=UPI0039ECBC83
MGFGLEGLASAVMGAVAAVAEAAIEVATEVADVMAAQADIANILEDGQIDEDEQDRLLDDINKLMVGAYLVGFGSIKFGGESGGSNEDCSVSSWDEDSENYISDFIQPNKVTDGAAVIYNNFIANRSTLSKTYDNEQIVISGNYDGNHAARNFIETAIKQIKDWKSEGNKNITWIVTDSGYTENDIERMKEVAKNNDINIMFIDNSEQVYQYINTGIGVDGKKIEDRSMNKITDITFFSHGIKDNGGTLALDYNDKNNYVNNNLNISVNDLSNSNIDKDSFSNPHTFFGACNAGTVQNGTSFANEWVKKIGGEVEAICDPTPVPVDENDHSGQTSYEHINDGKGWLWNREDQIKRKIGINFDEDGCNNYPTKGNDEINRDLYWTRILEDGSVEKIDKGGPRN